MKNQERAIVYCWFDTEYTDALEGDRTEARYTLDAPDGAIMAVRVANEEASERGVFATFEADEVYDQADAAGFIRLNALRLRTLGGKRISEGE